LAPTVSSPAQIKYTKLDQYGALQHEMRAMKREKPPDFSDGFLFYFVLPV
jgi:hypothetical protein